MLDDKNAGQPKKSPDTPNRFEYGDESCPIANRTEHEQRPHASNTDEKKLSRECTRLADVCQYFSARKVDIPPHLAERVGSLRRLEIPERIRALKEVNEALLKYLDEHEVEVRGFRSSR
jgi:hypothetical protein